MSRRKPVITFQIPADVLAARVAEVRKKTLEQGLVNFDDIFTDIAIDFSDELEAMGDFQEAVFNAAYGHLYDAVEDLHKQYDEFEEAEATKAVQS
jgi:hypothetical protein